MAHRLLVVDDSGNREYAQDRRYGLSGKSRHFVYGAVLIEADEASRFAARLQELKRLTFGTPDVVIKSNWLRIPWERGPRYLERYGLSDARLTAFTNGYYELTRQAPLELIAAIVDKLHMQEDYAEPWYAPTIAYEVLMQRAVQAIPSGDTLAVTVDDITGSTPRENEYKTLLSRHHEQLRRNGSRLRRDISFTCLNGPVRFMNSAHSDLLQVADLTAYNVLRQFRDHGLEWEQEGPAGRSLPMYDHFRMLSGKFRQGDGGRVQGYGIVKFPLRQRVRWVVTPEGGT